VTVDVGLVGSVIVPVPLTRVHTPVDGKIGTLPLRVVDVIGVHKSWSGPALADGLEEEKIVITTSSNVV
jgi:hypothetical protein